MKNKAVYFGAFIIFLVAIGLFIDKKFSQPDFAAVRLGGKIFSTEVAISSEKRENGLSGRAKLCDNCAMLFFFEDARVRYFWMKDMQFAVDIIWIKDNEIVGISPEISPAKGEAEVISSPVAVNKVLEINAGESERLGLKVGDVVEIIK